MNEKPAVPPHDPGSDRSTLRRRSSLKRTSARSSGHRLFLSWIEDDIENRFGFFRGGRYTSVNKTFSFILGLLLTGLFYGAVTYLKGAVPALDRYTIPFVREGNVWTVVPAMLFFFWGMTTLFIKQKKIDFQKRALDLTAVPTQPEFVLNETTARAVLERLHGMVDHPQHFILLNRIERSLASLTNIGAVSDVSAILKSQAENDENQMASSYTLLNGLVWATPVLGFIGTVLGLSAAIGEFTQTLGVDSTDLAAIKLSLTGVTSGLATAFETTLVALVCALIMQLYVNYLQQKESSLLDDASDYCHAHMISKLRLLKRGPTTGAGAPGEVASVPADDSVANPEPA